MLEIGIPSFNNMSRVLIFAALLIVAIFIAHLLRGGGFVERLSATLPLVTAASWVLSLVILAVVYISLYGPNAAFSNTSLIRFPLFILSPIAIAVMGMLAIRARTSARGSMLPTAVVLGSLGALSQFAWIALANN